MCQSEQGREGGRRYRDVREEESKERERREAWKKQMGERGMREGDGNGSRQWEKREGDAYSTASIPADPST